MKLDDMQAFIALVELQSTQQAAAHLGLTQPAVTRRVQNLEQALNVTLLDRQTKPLTPTSVGLQVYRQCLRIAQEVRNLQHQVASDNLPHGALNIGLPYVLSDGGVLGALSRLQQRYPDLKPQIRSGWGRDLLRQLQQRALDAALLLFPASQHFSGILHASSLGDVELAIVVAADAARKPKTLAESAQYGWVLNPDGCGFRASVMRALEDRGVPLRLNAEVQGSALQLAFIAEGRGLGIMPLSVVKKARQRFPLSVLSLRDFKPHTQLWLVHPSLTASQQAAMTLFGNQLAAEFREGASAHLNGAGL